MSDQVVAWPCTAAQVMDMPGRWVCVPDGAEELTGYGVDEDDATDEMIDQIARAMHH